MSAQGTVSFAEAIETSVALSATLRERAIERDRLREGIADGFELVANSGLLGAISTPTVRGYPTAAASVTRELGRGEPSLAFAIADHLLAGHLVAASGSASLLSRFTTASLAGELVAVADLRQREGKAAGSPIGRLAQKGSASERQWVLNATSLPSTVGLGAGWILFVLDENGELRLGLVAADASGVVPPPAGPSRIGLRSLPLGSWTFEDVVVNDEDVATVERPGVEAFDAVAVAHSELLQAAVDVGIVEVAIEEGTAYLRNQARAWRDAHVERATEDPLTVRRYGEIVARLHALEALLSTAARTLSEGVGSEDGSTVIDQAIEKITETRVYGLEAFGEIATWIVELTGAGSTHQKYGLDRHWRNLRAHELVRPLHRGQGDLGREFAASVLANGGHLVGVVRAG